MNKCKSALVLLASFASFCSEVSGMEPDFRVRKGEISAYRLVSDVGYYCKVMEKYCYSPVVLEQRSSESLLAFETPSVRSGKGNRFNKDASPKKVVRRNVDYNDSLEGNEEDSERYKNVTLMQGYRERDGVAYISEMVTKMGLARFITVNQ